MSRAETQLILDELADLRKQLAAPSPWIKGNVALARYMGSTDKSGRAAKAFAAAERIAPKLINGVPYYSLVDVDRAMRNGRAVETRRAG